MNREIKFRAWDAKKKEWLCGYEMSNLGGFSLFGEVVMLGEWTKILDTYIFERDGHKQEDLKVMQYTGLKDKNLKEIYEGDIAKSPMYNDSYKIENCISSIKCGYDGWEKGQLNHIPWGQLEIIGNIYENPELLSTFNKEETK